MGYFVPFHRPARFPLVVFQLFLACFSGTSVAPPLRVPSLFVPMLVSLIGPGRNTFPFFLVCFLVLDPRKNPSWRFPMNASFRFSPAFSFWKRHAAVLVWMAKFYQQAPLLSLFLREPLFLFSISGSTGSPSISSAPVY